MAVGGAGQVFAAEQFPAAGFGIGSEVIVGGACDCVPGQVDAAVSGLGDEGGGGGLG